MTELENLPPGADLFDSMRHIGYSLDTAIADILDNSIAAGARNINISFESANEIVSILDNGVGMSKDELRVAMRLAGNSTKKLRNKNDLGRFGLGLKTASLSQCRKLTVITRQSKAEYFAAQWDLDLVYTENSWTIKWLDSLEVQQLVKSLGVADFQHGTLVVWENLDLLLAGNLDRKIALTDALARAGEHISLVFHRYLDGGPSERVSISLNGIGLKAIDPFFQSNTGTQRKPEEVINVEGFNVVVKPYILPHLSKMTREERYSSDFLNSRFIETQGFYIYRLKRLISFGSWFRIEPKSELAKLARVMVDISPDMDGDWKLGIMKSTLEVPSSLKKKLRELVPEIVNESKRVVTRRGVALSAENAIGAWEFRELGKDTFNVELSNDNPLLLNLFERLSSEDKKTLKLYLAQIEMTLPVVEITTRITGDKSHSMTFNKENLLEQGFALVQILCSQGKTREEAVEMLERMPPFSGDLAAKDFLNKNKATILRGFATSLSLDK